MLAAWKSAVQYGGIALGVVLLIAVIGFVVYKKTHKDRVEVIVVKENDDDDNKNRGPGILPSPSSCVVPVNCSKSNTMIAFTTWALKIIIDIVSENQTPNII